MQIIEIFLGYHFHYFFQILSWIIRFWITNPSGEVSMPWVFLSLIHWPRGRFITRMIHVLLCRITSSHLSRYWPFSPQWLLSQCFIWIQFIGLPLTSRKCLIISPRLVNYRITSSINQQDISSDLICRLTALRQHGVLCCQRFIRERGFIALSAIFPSSLSASH